MICPLCSSTNYKQLAPNYFTLSILNSVKKVIHLHHSLLCLPLQSVLQLFQGFLLVRGQFSFLPLGNIPRHRVDILSCQVLVISHPFCIERFVEMKLWCLVVMLKLLTDVEVANCTHLPWQLAVVQLEDVVVETQTLSKNFLQLGLHY